MSTPPAGTISLAIDNFRTLLASCAEFRTWAGVANEAAAKLKIHVTFPEPGNGQTFTTAELDGLRPYAVVELDDENGLISTAGSSSSFDHKGRLSVYLIQSVDGELDVDEARMQFNNAVGQIYDELCSRSRNNATEDTYLNISRITIASGPGRAPEDKASGQGPEFGVRLLVDWDEA